MCFGCYEEFGKPTIINNRTERAAFLIEKVYEYSLVGGNCHIVTDDWNIDDDSIFWCL